MSCTVRDLKLSCVENRSDDGEVKCFSCSINLELIVFVCFNRLLKFLYTTLIETVHEREVFESYRLVAS